MMPRRTFLVVLAAAVLVAGALVPLGSAAPPRAAAGPGTFLSVYQTPLKVTPTSGFSVHVQLASSANVIEVYFTFCQLTSSQCYSPIVMKSLGQNWYSGATKAMTSYSGMTAWVHGGYNITVLYTDGSNASAPVLPNPFHNLSIAQTITGENMYEVTVTPDVFALTGRVVDSHTGAAVAGATVALSPSTLAATTTGATGSYSFAGLTNGSYNLTVTATGFHSGVYPVTIAGAAVSKDLSLTSTSGTSRTGGGGGNKSSSSPGFLTTPLGLALIAVVLIVVALLAVLLLRGRGKQPSGADASSASSAPKERPASPPGS